MITIKDRIPSQPNRRKIIREGTGETYYATIERADNPTEVGTPLNKATLLQNSTATALGLPDPDNATVDDALKITGFGANMAKLLSFTLSSDTFNFYLDVSGLNLSAYASILLVWRASAPPGDNLCMRFNDDSGVNYSSSSAMSGNVGQFVGNMNLSGLAGETAGQITISTGTIGLMYKASFAFIPSVGTTTHYNGSIVGSWRGVALSGLTKINLFSQNSTGKITAGSKFTLYGLKG